MLSAAASSMPRTARDHKELLDQIAIEYQVPPEYLLGVDIETQSMDARPAAIA